MAVDPPRAVLWDFGGVILSSPFEAFNRYEAANGLPRDFIRSVNATDPDTNAWARFERSEIGFDEFCDLFEAEARAAGHAVAARDVMPLLAGEVRPAMVTALRRCKEHGLATAMLTNNVRLAPSSAGGVRLAPSSAGGVRVAPSSAGGVRSASSHDRDHRHAEVLALFDVIVESSKAGVRKPDPRFYLLACDQLGVQPTDAVFLDDLGVNLKPARELGMHTIKVGDPDVAIKELEAVVGFALR